MIIFLDYYLEAGLTANAILEEIDVLEPAPVTLIVSSAINKETVTDTRHMGAVGFIGKDSYAPERCRILLEQIISKDEI